MGKVVGKILKVAGAGLLALTGIGAVLGGWTVLGMSYATALTVAAVASTVGGLLDPPKLTDTESIGGHARMTLNTIMDPDAPRFLVFGHFGTGGVLRYQEEVEIGSDEDPNNLWMVIILAGHEIESISDTIQFGGEDIVINPITNTPASGKYQNNLYMWKHLGSENQTVDINLDAASTLWTAAHRLRGCAYVVIKIVANPEVYEDGIKPFKFSGQGMKIYDPRLDSTNGGSGPQRLATPSTWTFSANSVLVNTMYRYGIYMNGLLIAGMGISGERIGWANTIAEANICDEPVALAAGGTEPRYECNGIIDPRNSHEKNLDIIDASMAGNTTEQSGLWNCYAGAARTAVKSRSRDDALGGTQFTSYKSKEEKYNGVKGQFISANDGYNLLDVTPYQDATFLSEDNNEPRWLNIPLMMVTSVTQAQRIMRIYLNRTRMEKAVSFQMAQKGLQDTVMDAVSYTHEGYGLTAHKMIVTEWAMKFSKKEGAVGFFFDVAYIEEADSVYTWTTDDELRFASATEQVYIPGAPLPAIRVIGDTGTLGDSVFDRVDTALEADGSRLAYGLSVNQGDDVSRSLTIGGAYNTAADGDTITYATPWTSEQLPDIVFGSGGISSSSTLTAPYGHEYIALSPSTTGFTMKARLKELLSGITTITDTGATTVIVGEIYDMDKSVVAEALDDVYSFQFDVVIANNPSEPDSGYITIGVYTNDGGGFIQRATKTYYGNGSEPSTTLNNQVISITVDGLGQIAGKEFRIVRDSVGLFGGAITSFDSVTYLNGSTPADETATPAGAKEVQWQLQGGNESGI